MANGLKINGNGATLTGTMKVIAWVVTITVPMVTVGLSYGSLDHRVAQTETDIQEIKQDEREHVHITASQWQRLEDNMDTMAREQVRLVQELVSAREEITRLRSLFEQHRRETE